MTVEFRVYPVHSADIGKIPADRNHNYRVMRDGEEVGFLISHNHHKGFSFHRFWEPELPPELQYVQDLMSPIAKDLPQDPRGHEKSCPLRDAQALIRSIALDRLDLRGMSTEQLIAQARRCRVEWLSQSASVRRKRNRRFRFYTKVSREIVTAFPTWRYDSREEAAVCSDETFFAWICCQVWLDGVFLGNLIQRKSRHPSIPMWGFDPALRKHLGMPETFHDPFLLPCLHGKALVRHIDKENLTLTGLSTEGIVQLAIFARNQELAKKNLHRGEIS